MVTSWVGEDEGAGRLFLANSSHMKAWSSGKCVEFRRREERVGDPTGDGRTFILG